MSDVEKYLCMMLGLLNKLHNDWCDKLEEYERSQSDEDSEAEREAKDTLVSFQNKLNDICTGVEMGSGEKFYLDGRRIWRSGCYDVRRKYLMHDGLWVQLPDYTSYREQEWGAA